MSGDDFQNALVSAIPHLRAFARSFTSDAAAADDLVQETLTKAWNSQGSFQPGTNFRAWLFTIQRNTFFTQQRKAKREIGDPDLTYTHSLSVGADQPGHIDLQDLKSALDTLPEEQREAILLVGAAGFSYEEAAEICGCAVGTIKSRVNRARSRLEELIGPPDGPISFQGAPEPQAIARRTRA